MVRSCHCPGVFAEAQARFVERMQSRRARRLRDRRRRIDVHARCEECQAVWILLWQKEK